MNKLIYILIIFSLLFIIKNINITNILILIIIFVGGYIYYNIYEKNIKDIIINKFNKFKIFKQFNNYTYNNTKKYINLFLKETHLIEDLENIRIIINNNLLSFKINIPYKLYNLLNKYIYNLNIYLIKYIKELNNDYKGNYLRTNNFNNKFDYY